MCGGRRRARARRGAELCRSLRGKAFPIAAGRHARRAVATKLIGRRFLLLLRVAEDDEAELARIPALRRRRECRIVMASYETPPAAVTLDIDDTLDVVHGHQQLALFNAHY